MSSSNSSSDEEFRYNTREHRVAKKSTSVPSAPIQKHYETRRNRPGAPKNLANDRFLQNFNPETSVREKRKLSRKINPPSNVRRPPGALYDENGYHIATYVDLCDCLTEECLGCFFPCPKCNSPKCGFDCRVHRKFVYEQLEYHGYDTVIKFPLSKTN